MSEKISNAADNPGCLPGKPVEEEIVYIPAESTLRVTNKPPMPVTLPFVVTTNAFPPLGKRLALAMPLGFLACTLFLRWASSLPMPDVLGFSGVAAAVAAMGVFVVGSGGSPARRGSRIVISRDSLLDTRTMTRPVNWSEVLHARVVGSHLTVDGLRVTLADVSAIAGKSILDEHTHANQIFIRLDGAGEDCRRAAFLILRKFEDAGAGRAVAKQGPPGSSNSPVGAAPEIIDVGMPTARLTSSLPPMRFVLPVSLVYARSLVLAGRIGFGLLTALWAGLAWTIARSLFDGTDANNPILGVILCAGLGLLGFSSLHRMIEGALVDHRIDITRDGFQDRRVMLEPVAWTNVRSLKHRPPILDQAAGVYDLRRLDVELENPARLRRPNILRRLRDRLFGFDASRNVRVNLSGFGPRPELLAELFARKAGKTIE